jgi:hypothetical protein
MGHKRVLTGYIPGAEALEVVKGEIEQMGFGGGAGDAGGESEAGEREEGERKVYVLDREFMSFRLPHSSGTGRSGWVS